MANFRILHQMVVDGSTQDIERDMVVKWEVELEHVDPQELERMGEEAVRNLVEKIGGESGLGARPRSFFVTI